MSKSINLLGIEKQVSAKRISQKIKVLRTIAVSILFLVSGLSIVLFLLIELSPLPTLQKQEQDELAKIAQYHSDIAKYLLIKERLKSSETILAKRSNYDQGLNKIEAKIPEGASITAMKMNRDEFTITVTSTSLTQLDIFLNSLIDAAKKKQDFSKVTLKKFITSQDNGSFSVILSFVML